VQDITAIADALGLDRFAVVGRSGGAPHALACAALLPHRVTRAAAVVSLAPPDAVGLDWFAGMAPYNEVNFRFACSDPEGHAAELIARSDAIRRNPARLLDELRQDLTDEDLQIVSDAGIRFMLLRNYQEALRSSPYGWIDDILALCGPWGFDPAAIRVPVLLWHGRRDGFSPVSHWSWLAERIPGATAVLDPAAAHFAAFAMLPSILAWVQRDAEADAT
jgi:pimeloyl-ACP methyl ester carboxylesterase